MASATKVFWNQTEKEMLIAATREQVQAGKLTLRALHLAQAVLPPERRRTVAALTSMPWLVAAFTPEARAAAAARLTAPPPSAPTAPRPARQPLQAALSAALADALAQCFRAACSVPAAREALQRRLFTRHPQPLASPAVPTHVQPFHVLIAGVSPSQQPRLEAQFGSQLTLSFWQSGETKDRLRLLAKTADIGISSAELIPASADATVRSLSPHYIRNKGGLAHLEALLIRLSSESSARVAANAL